MSANVVPNANARWNWPSSGMTGISETRPGKQNRENAEDSVDQRWIFWFVTWPKAQEPQKGSDMVDQVII